MDPMKSLQDLKLTKDEVDKLSEAFKKEEFRKLFTEYAEEISNPENRRLYEEEITKLEQEQGMDVTFIHPEPGYVLKTSQNDDKKIFINICKNENIEKPKFDTATKDGKRGMHWSIPHSFSKPRTVLDRAKNQCEVYDFVVHHDTYRMSETNQRFKNMVEDTAIDGIERTFAVTIDRKNIKKPKMSYKGTPEATIMRKKKPNFKKEETISDVIPDLKYPYDKLSSEEKTREMKESAQKKKEKTEKETKGILKAKEGDDMYKTPKFILKHQKPVDLQDFLDASEVKTRPTNLLIEIFLPLISSGTDIDLDIQRKQLILQTEKPAKYKLILDLPFPVEEEDGTAKFEKDLQKLRVVLPVVPDETPQAAGDSAAVNTLTNGFHDDKAESEEEKESVSAPPLIEVVGETGQEEQGVRETDEQQPVDYLPTATQVHHVLPSYTYHQNDEMLTFVISAKNVDRDSLVKDFLETGLGCTGVEVTMQSVGMGGFPISYRLRVMCQADNKLSSKESYVDVSSHNVVVNLAKSDACLGPWDKVLVGRTTEDMEVSSANTLQLSVRMTLQNTEISYFKTKTLNF